MELDLLTDINFTCNSLLPLIKRLGCPGQGGTNCSEKQGPSINDVSTQGGRDLPNGDVAREVARI